MVLRPAEERPENVHLQNQQDSRGRSGRLGSDIRGEPRQRREHPTHRTRALFARLHEAQSGHQSISGFFQLWDTFALGDFNKDGRLDLVVLVGGPDSDPFPLGLIVLLQAADGTFTKKIEYTLPNTDIPSDFVVADFNEDGHLDIVVEDPGTDLVMLLGKG